MEIIGRLNLGVFNLFVFGGVMNVENDNSR